MIDISNIDEKDLALLGFGVCVGVLAGLFVGAMVKTTVQEIDRADPELLRDVLRDASGRFRSKRKATMLSGDDMKPAES